MSAGAGTRDGKGVQQLRRDKRRAEDDAEDGGGAHFAGNRPDDADGQHMEDGFADKPEELVHPRPEDGGLRQRLAVEHFDFADEVAEAEDEAAADERGDDRRENFAEGAHDALQQVLLAAGRSFHRIFGYAFDAGQRGECFVELADFVADDDLELPRLGEGALDAGNAFNARHVRPLRVFEDEAQAGDAVGDGIDVVLAADGIKQQGRVLLESGHANLLFLKVV